MGKWSDLSKRIRGVGDPFTPTESEYRAALNALNIFFGAVIGVSLGGIEALSRFEYAVVLMVISTCVIAILYVVYSHRRVWNSVMLAIILYATWEVFERDPVFDQPLPDKLLPTLWIWALMALLTEFAPRRRDPA